LKQLKYKSRLEYSYSTPLLGRKEHYFLEAFGNTAKSAEKKVISMFEEKAKNWVSYSHPSYFIDCIKTFDPKWSKKDVLEYCYK
jgi:hypothetical protein